MAKYCSSRFSVCSLLQAGNRRGGSRRKSKSISFDVFVTAVYLPHARQYKKSWAVDERIARQHLSATFGRLRFAKISRKIVEGWLRNLSEQRLAPATCNRILHVFKSICALAVRHELIPKGRSPCAGIPPFKIRTLRERYLSEAQSRQLVDALDRARQREALAVKLLLLTGARKSEILRAQWKHVHLEQCLLTVPNSKSGKPRHIQLSDASIAVILSIPRRPGCPWLFPGRWPDKPLADIYRFWDGLRRRLGLDEIRIHDLRHTFASMLVNTGHSLYAVQKLLGHSDPRTTTRYAHLGQASLLAAAQTVSARLVPPRGDDTGGAESAEADTTRTDPRPAANMRLKKRHESGRI